MSDVQRRRLGSELRRLREAAGMSQEQAGAVLDRDQNAISRLELGRRRIRNSELGELLDAYGVEDQALRQELGKLAKAGAERPWYAPYASSLSPNYQSFISFEGSAAEIHGWEPALIHGLLQTEDYAREVIKGVGRELDTVEVERRVEIRMGRQAAVAKTTPRVWAIVWEPALLCAVGNREIMRDQLRHVLDLTGEPHITIQVVPFQVGAHPGVLGPMTIMKFAPPDKDVVYLETSAGDLYPVKEVAHACTLGYDYLRALALDPPSSVERIRQALGELEKEARDA